MCVCVHVYNELSTQCSASIHNREHIVPPSEKALVCFVRFLANANSSKVHCAQKSNQQIRTHAHTALCNYAIIAARTLWKTATIPAEMSSFVEKWAPTNLSARTYYSRWIDKSQNKSEMQKDQSINRKQSRLNHKKKRNQRLANRKAVKITSNVDLWTNKWRKNK